MPNIPIPQLNIPIVADDGSMMIEFARWVRQVTETDIIIGAGSPEGVVAASVGREYMDSAGVAGAIKYIKRDADIAGDRAKGWVLV